MRNLPSVCGHFWCDHRNCTQKHSNKPKRINTKDHFELRYLRWDYFVRTNNPKNENIFHENRKTIDNYAVKYFLKYEDLLRLNSLDMDDLKNIIRCFIVSYDGLWSFDADAEKLERFREKFFKEEGCYPSPEILSKKNNSNMMSFIEQKLDDMINVFRIKNKDQAGFYSDEFFKIGAKVSKEKINLPSFGSNPTKEGWKKVSKKEYFELKPLLMQIGKDKAQRIGNYFYKSFMSGGQIVDSKENEDGVSLFDSFVDDKPDALSLLIGREELDLSIFDDFAKKSSEEKASILDEAIAFAKKNNFDHKDILLVETLRKKYGDDQANA